MRALTIRQPWATAILWAGKDVENRTQSLGPYRGTIAIHAGKWWKPQEVLDAIATFPPLEPETEARLTSLDRFGGIPFYTGAIIGLAELVDVHLGDCLTIETYREGHEQQIGTCSGWAIPDQYHLVLENPRPFMTPIPTPGRLGLWHPGRYLEDRIAEQAAEPPPRTWPEIVADIATLEQLVDPG